jgi:hypothetical protein
MLARWDVERNAARQAACTVLDDPGRLGLRRAAVSRATEQLVNWADRWRSHLADLPADPGRIAQFASRRDARSALWEAFDAAARRDAERSHPEHAALRTAADAARHAQEQARRVVAEARRSRDDRLSPFGALAQTPDPAARLTDLDRDIAATRHQLATARARIAQLQADPALLGQVPDLLTHEREAWRTRRAAGHHKSGSVSPRPATLAPGVPRPKTERHGRSVVRGGTAPGLGR